MPDTTEITTIEQKDSIKLIKNTKGYNWEIRILSTNVEELERLNNEMIRKFGSVKDELDLPDN